METSTLIILIIFALLIGLYVKYCYEQFEIEPNTVTGGYNAGSEDFELDSF
jgi:hypothetical protein